MVHLNARVTICPIVWDSWPHASQSCNPHLYIIRPLLPWPVLIRFNVAQVLLERSNPGCLIVGLVTNFWSSGFSVIQSFSHIELMLNFSSLFSIYM